MRDSLREREKQKRESERERENGRERLISVQQIKAGRLTGVKVVQGKWRLAKFNNKTQKA